MSEPTVCAIMLTRDRPELARKAVECFRAQTYESKHLLILNTGDDLEISHASNEMQVVAVPGMTIGGLRNHAMEYCRRQDIFIHLDDDDWSSPNRIAEQVELLQTSGADVVGYNDMLFWRSAGIGRDGQAWLYTVIPGLVPALGTSLCYWRETWEKQKFADAPGPQGGSEYGAWVKGLRCETVTSMGPYGAQLITNPAVVTKAPEYNPRMIARIHAGNASRHAYNLEHHVKHQGTPVTWKRVPEWDERVGRILG